MAELSALDRKIIEAAKPHFFAEGIYNTDMKQLAAEVGISRSTLYRHFPNSLHIAFYVIKDYVEFLLYDDESLFEDICGYEGFSLYVHRLVSRLCGNLPMIRILQEFDTLYTSKPVDAVPPEDYTEYMGSDQQQLIYKLFQKGLKDGSIRFKKNSTIGSASFIHTALALVERIMLREKIYLDEHGASREYIDYTIDMMLASIRA